MNEYDNALNEITNSSAQSRSDRPAAEARTLKNAIRGCIFGGAVGDALGYSVEFLNEKAIFSRFGSAGITEYEKDADTGKALISDDTQMTLFTANGLLVGETRGKLRGIQASPSIYVELAYHDWYLTQRSSFRAVKALERCSDRGGYSWLLDVPELFSERAPGITCLSALEKGVSPEDYIKAKRNNSKGCGGVMRVAPAALYRELPTEELDMEAAQIAAITHGHSLGYMPAAVLVHIINRLVFRKEGQKPKLKETVIEARDAVNKLFEGDPHLPELTDIIDRAIMLSENGASDLQNIHELGEGWVGEEALAIALYCALKYSGDFSAGVIAAVNHRGDSDSTGAVAGNILGALLGYGAIEKKWKKDLELSDLILEIADDLFTGCRTSEYGNCADPAWSEKYVNMRRYTPKPVLFWREAGENGCFSNWYSRSFTVDGQEYAHVEQYMMAQKAKLFGDEKTYRAIMSSPEPGVCKELGKQVKPFDSKKWDAVRFDVVKTASRAKYEQNPDLKERLMKTGSALLAEASPRDAIWGIGMDAESAAKTDPSEWKGRNLLGKVLMELRSEFSE